MSRRPRPETQFGSDSFLDIVCNVVGILIILMVVAGVRASRTPVLLPAMSVTESPIPRPQPTSEPESLPLPVLFAAEVVEEPMPPVPEPAPVAQDPPEPVIPPPDLVARAEQLRRELKLLDASVETSADRIAAVKRQQGELQEQLNALQKQQAEQMKQLELSQQRRAATDVELDHLRRVAAQLARALQEQAAKTPPAKALEHRINPIGQAVTGNELHFRVLNDRVAVVPLDRLVDRLKSQIDRHKDWLAKSRQQLGQVGPIEGFSMHYVVERDSGSLADELRMGPGVFRISVSEWRLEAERSIPTESAAEALQPGSRFSSALAAAEPGSAMTFWVYPDSFGAYSELKAHCQRLNFLIAGRPLPHGIPIAGSPTGTRSTGQ
jgi:hypothetical protein